MGGYTINYVRSVGNSSLMRCSVVRPPAGLEELDT